MGIFDQEAGDLFTRYAVEVSLRDKIMGGTPRDPKIVLNWLKARMGIDELEELRVQTIKVLQEMGSGEKMGLSLEMMQKMTIDELEAAAERLGETRQTNGFRRDDISGLYIEDRQIKSMLKEATNILFAGERWGTTKKGPKSYLSERVFAEGADCSSRIYLGVNEPSGVDTFVGHVTGPQGPRSTLTRYEFVYQPRISFEVWSLNDCVTHEQWVQLWVLAQKLGIGALRSQGYGRFDLTKFEAIKRKGLRKVS